MSLSLWEQQRSLVAPERYVAYRVTKVFLISYFTYARLRAQQKEQASYADYFRWLEQQPGFAENMRVFTTLAKRHCEGYTHGVLQAWACPLKLWQPKALEKDETCTVHGLGTQEF